MKTLGRRLGSQPFIWALVSVVMLGAFVGPITVSADELSDAQAQAHTILNDTLSGLTESDFTPASWTIVNTIKTDADAAVDAATDVDGVVAAIESAFRAWFHNALNDALLSADESAYSPANWALLNSIKADADIALDAAADIDEMIAVIDKADADLDAVPFLVTLTYAPGEHGTLTGTLSQTIDEGTDGTAVEAVAEEGYHFGDWSDGSTANPRIDGAVSADVSVTANFIIDKVPEPQPVHRSSGGGGGGGGSSRKVTTTTAPVGQVLGATTSATNEAQIAAIKSQLVVLIGQLITMLQAEMTDQAGY